MKLGKLAAKWHPKTLRFAQFVPETLPEPAKVFWGYKVPGDSWDVLGNDVAGDCVVAGAMHMIMNWSAHTGATKTFTTDQAIALYSELSGYDPSTGANDNGLVMTEFLEHWRTAGVCGSKILGWMAFDHANRDHFNIVGYLFGGVYVGQQIPQSAMDQFETGEAWSVVSGSPVEGGHCTPYFNYGAQGRKMITWGKLQAAENAWIDAYVDEAYGVISEDWFDVNSKLAPSHVNVDQLWAAVKQLQV